MTWGKENRCQTITIDELYERIRPGDRIFISSGSATPIRTISSIMEADHANLFDLEIMQLAIPDADFPIGKTQSRRYTWKTFNVGESIAQGVSKENIDFIPSNLPEIPYLFYSDALEVNVAVIQTSFPDNKGFVNLGVAADVADLVIKNAPLTIAEMNPNVPTTHGETSVHIDKFAACIESDLPLIEKIAPPCDEITDRIGWHVANIIDDNSTVALHFGTVFHAIARHLTAKRDLRICTHTVSDWVMGLIDSGALAPDRGFNHQGIIMASYCLGSSALYEYVNQNPFFNIVPMLRPSYQTTLPKIPRLVSIIDAVRVDITGNAVVLEPDDYFLPGFEGKLAFSMASSLSRRGKSIVAVRSLDSHGNSNIVINHAARDQVRSTLGTTRYVVTEYGIANVAGKSIRERTLAIIDIAHPDHREVLIEQAKEAGYIYGDQIYVAKYTAHYPFSLETVKTFEKDVEVKFRPIRSSDEEMMRRLFYGSSDKSKMMRYFSPVRVMPRTMMQPYVNIDYEQTLSIVGTIQHRGREKIIAEARYSYDEEGDAYDMAFIVDEDYQGKGIATYLMNYLMDIARERGLTRMSAVTLTENMSMLKVLQSARVKPHIRRDAEQVLFRFDLVGTS